MTVGDRVTTKHGPGRITQIHIDDRWSFGSRKPVAYVIVHVDGEPYGRILLPDQVQPIDAKEQLTMETTETANPMGGMLIQPLEEPEPTPTDPEPEPEGDEEELTEWP